MFCRCRLRPAKMGRFRKDKKTTRKFEISTVPSTVKGLATANAPIYNALGSDAALKTADDAPSISACLKKGMPIRSNVQSKKQKLQSKRKQFIDRVVQRQKFDKKSTIKSTKRKRQKLQSIQKLKPIDMSALKSVLSEMATAGDLNGKSTKSQQLPDPFKAPPKVSAMPINSEAGSLIRIKRKQLNTKLAITSETLTDLSSKQRKDGKLISIKKKQKCSAKYRITHLSKLIADEMFRKNPRQVIKQHIHNKVCQAKFSTN